MSSLLSYMLTFVGVVSVLAGVAAKSAEATTMGFAFLLAATIMALHAVASAISATTSRRSDASHLPPAPSGRPVA